MKGASSILLVLLLLTAPRAARAQFNCSTNPDNTLTITGYTGSSNVIVIPANINGTNVTGIGAQAFFNDATLSGVTILTNIIRIGDDAFGNCEGLTAMTIPDSVTNLGVDIFQACTNLATIGVDGSNGYYSSVDGVLFDKTGSTIIEYPGGRAGSYAVPTNAASIGAEAFLDCPRITGITMPAGLTNIGEEAFLACSSLGSVAIPQGVTDIQFGTFDGCISLSNVVIPNSVTNIDASAFNGCNSLSNIIIPGSVFSIGNAAFLNCSSLTDIVLPESVTNIGQEAFINCGKLTSVVLPTNLASIGSEAFAHCGALTNIVLPDSVNNIGFSLFFGASNLTSVTIPDSVTNIAEEAFDGCSSLSNITIPGSVTNIGGDAFQNCTNLTSVNFTGNAPAGDSTIFASDTNVTIYYLPGTTGWSNGFGGVTVLPAGFGSLQVVINPAAAVAAGAQWQVDGGAFQVSGAVVTNLSTGSHTISFSAVSGSSAPPDRGVTISADATAVTVGLYVPLVVPADGLILITNGVGIITHAHWPAHLIVGDKYTVIATPKAKNVFVNWYGGTNQPYSTQSASAHYTFVMQSNLVLEANFQTNYFLAAAGSYKGLFAPSNGPRQQAESGAFSLNITSGGTVSGTLDLGGQNVPVSGKFDATGAATLVSKATRTAASVTTALQLDFADQSISGTVSNASFVAELSGDRAVFIGTNKAKQFEGQYTLDLPGTNDPSVGPFGASYGTVKVSSSGGIVLAGSLADGTALSQSTTISKDGRWPFYVSLYGGKGSIWGWNTITNGNIIPVSSVSWINGTNSSKAAAYRSGFTNQNVALTGGSYVSNPLGLPSALSVVLETGGFAITNVVNLASNDKITLANPTTETNKLSLTVNKTTGVISGKFANPADPKLTIKVNGVILQNQTNAAGYFLSLPQSGSFILAPP